MTQEEIQRIALAQSAADLNCKPEDFLCSENVLIRGGLGSKARRYYSEPICANLVSYGSNIVCSVQEPFRETVADFINRFEFYHCFETPNLHVLSAAMEPMGAKVCFMAEYWLPDLSRLRELSCAYELRVLTHKDFAPLYRPEWSNALCEKRKELDTLGVGAYDGGRLIGLAGCSADCDTMWQLGIDVLPAYRRQGIASALTSRLAIECLAREKVPFYCCAWSNIASARNAVASGFSPAWAELTVKPAAIVDAMNR